jgi:hypothetical protein
MKLYTIFSPSHEVLYKEYFLKTLPDEFELEVRKTEQLCNTGVYFSNGWEKAMMEKANLFIEACENNMGKHFFFCDVDVLFHGNVLDQLVKEIEDYDVAFQDDTGKPCAGLFICKANERTLEMFKTLKKIFKDDDQQTLYKCVDMCKYKLLSRDKFFTTGNQHMDVWRGQDFDVPNDMLIHHANWVIGIENKMKVLQYAREKLLKQRNILK